MMGCRNRTKKIRYTLLSLMVSGALLPTESPASLTEQSQYIEQQYKEMDPELVRRNAVLYHMEQGKLAFDTGDYESAGIHFNQAITHIETVYANNPDAVKARELFSKEERKPFKGETYERAMVYYYRGLLDLMQHDYDNARASFEGGLIQDSLGLNRDFVQDFATLEYLSGWAGRCAGFTDKSEESFKRAQALNPNLKRPADNKKTLIVGESGIVPFKYYNTDLGGDLRYWQHPLDRLTFSTMSYGKTEMAHSDELYYQARTRGNRIADQIALAKENIKQQAASAGKSSQDIAGLAMLAANVTTLVPGLNLISMGLLTVTSAGIMTTAAFAEFSDLIDSSVDIRQWKTLPNRIYLTNSTNSADKTLKYIRFRDSYGESTGSEKSILTGEGRCQLVRARHQVLDTPQLSSWEAIQFRLSTRAYPISGVEKYWEEVKYEK